MATSGTIGQTRIKTVKLIEKALRRCGLAPSSITPDVVELAQEDLFFFLTSDACRGLNLWCVDKQLSGLTVGRAKYDLPVGTIDLLNVLNATPSRAAGTLSATATSVQTMVASAVTVVRLGIKFTTAPALPATIAYSSDGTTWTDVATIATAPALRIWSWYDLDPAPSALYIRVTSTSIGSVSDMYLATECREVAVQPLNRDDYSNLPDKTRQSNPVLNYYLEKTVTPTVTLWPVPNDDTQHLVMYRYRQIQDVGTMSEELELPTRWFEPICWQLALRLAFELPNVDPARRQEIGTMAGSMTLTVEGAESDHAPINIAPNISPYTR